MAEDKPMHPKLAHPTPHLLEHFIELATKASLILSMTNAEEPIRNTGLGFFDAANKETEHVESVSMTTDPKPI